MRGIEGFAGKVNDPVPELIMMRCDEAVPLAVEGMENC